MDLPYRLNYDLPEAKVTIGFHIDSAGANVIGLIVDYHCCF